MERFWEIVKSHPWLVAGGVFLTVLIFYYLGSGSSSGQTATGTAYNPYSDPNVIAAQAQEQIAQTQANASLAGLQAQIGGATTIASLQAGLLGQQSSDQLAALADQANALVAIQQSQTNASIANTANTNATQLAIAQTNNATTLSLAQNAAAANLALQQNANATAYGIAGLQLQSTEVQANLAAYETASNNAVSSQKNLLDALKGSLSFAMQWGAFGQEGNFQSLLSAVTSGSAAPTGGGSNGGSIAPAPASFGLGTAAYNLPALPAPAIPTPIGGTTTGGTTGSHVVS